MGYIPKIIQSIPAVAFDNTIENRFDLLNLDQLLLRIEDDNSVDFFIDFFGARQFIDFLQGDSSIFRFNLLTINAIVNNSGTLNSIKSIALFLGAADCVVDTAIYGRHYNGVLTYNGKVKYQLATYSYKYNGAFRYDGKVNYRPQVNKRCLDIKCYGVIINATTFKNKFKKLFELTQPISYYIENLELLV